MNTNLLRSYVAEFHSDRAVTLRGGDKLDAALLEAASRIDELQQHVTALEAKLDGLLGMGGGLDAALAKRDERIEALEAQLAPAPVDPLVDFFANTPTAEKQEADAKAVETVKISRAGFDALEKACEALIKVAFELAAPYPNTDEFRHVATHANDVRVAFDAVRPF